MADGATADTGADEVSEHDESAIFEILDFTTASPWETLALDVEKLIRSWGLAAGEEAATPATETREEDIKFNGREFTLLHWVKPTAEDGQPAGLGRPTVQEPFLGKETTIRMFREGGFEEIPGVMAALLSIPYDFVRVRAGHPVGHPVGQRFGVTEFLVIVSRMTDYSDKISPSEARMIASALSVALATTRCELPGFTQVDESRKENFVGCALGNGMLTSFDTTSTNSVPRAYGHLSGLLGLFRSKIQVVNPNERVSISARFTYTLRNWFDDWMLGDEQDDETELGTIFGEAYLANPADKIPIGLSSDPLHAINLFTAWPHFHENAVMENALHSELDPKVAPSWSLQAETHAVTQGKLAETLAAFAEMMDCSTPWQQVLDAADLGGAASEFSAEKRDAKDAFRNLTRSPEHIPGQKLGGKLKTMVGNTIKTGVKKVRGNRESDDAELLDEDLDAIWLRLFGEDDWDTTVRYRSAGKAAPDHSFVDELAVTVALVHANGNGLVGVASLWKEILQDIEYNYWEQLRTLPRVPEGQPPDMGCCLLFQKLQMVNCCIGRQLARNNLVAQKKAARKAEQKKVLTDEAAAKPGRQSAAGAVTVVTAVAAYEDEEEDSDDEFQSADDMESDAEDEDDVYYLAPEDEAGAIARNAELHASASEAAAADSGQDAAPPPLGVKSVHPSLTLLTLLGSDGATPLNIPVTQEEGPMTEDMVERKQALMTEMGTSEEAVQARVQMQSMSLRSDMMAFKAANPGCTIADFVRWHSPRDYVTEDDGSGHLSERMKQPGNLWNQIWSDAEPKPVNRQRPLFDATKESLAAIEYLSSMSPATLAWQLFPSLLRLVQHVLTEKVAMQVGDGEGTLDADIQMLTKMCNGLGNGFERDRDAAPAIIEQVATIEKKLYLARSLAHKLGQDEGQLIAQLLTGSEVPLLTDGQRTTIYQLFTHTSGEIGDPDVREFIFRLLSKQPASISRPGVNRMYCSLSDEHFRVAGAFSEDRVFGN